MMLEPGTGEVLEIPAGLSAFHDEELVDYRNEALASDFFNAWSDSFPDAVPLGISECVGFRVPLFLGGRDAVDNLEVTDFDVYWDTSKIDGELTTEPIEPEDPKPLCDSGKPSARFA